MSTLVMMLLVVQVVGGAYLFSAVASAGSASSTARASRLPPLLVFGHAMLGLAAPTLWGAWDPADVRVAEKHIPKPVLAGHGLLAAVLVGLVLAVGLGA